VFILHFNFLLFSQCHVAISFYSDQWWYNGRCAPHHNLCVRLCIDWKFRIATNCVSSCSKFWCCSELPNGKFYSHLFLLYYLHLFFSLTYSLPQFLCPAYWCALVFCSSLCTHFDNCLLPGPKVFVILGDQFPPNAIATDLCTQVDRQEETNEMDFPKLLRKILGGLKSIEKWASNSNRNFLTLSLLPLNISFASTPLLFYFLSIFDSVMYLLYFLQLYYPLNLFSFNYYSH
jgi:hypothetical protein